MRFSPLAAVVWLAFAARIPAEDEPLCKYVGADAISGFSAAVIVPDLPLVHTAQLLPLDDGGELAAHDAAGQLDRLLERLEKMLQSAGSKLELTVKLNVYVTREELAPAVWRKLATRWPAQQRPAVSLVVTALPRAEALVALDAVAALAPAAEPITNVKLAAQVATLPGGSRLYVSGQAEPGTLVEATRKTLQSLTATLKHCGRGDRDVVQLKCFLQPMSSVAEVQEEIARYYSEHAPPASFVEWRSSAPIEIELVVWGGKANAAAAEPLEFVTPPPLQPSPLFSRVARIQRGGTIFLSDVAGASSAKADDQVQLPFARLGKLLAQAGSDYRHLAKATYYVTDDEVSLAHNAARPKFFDAARPPAASKAQVAGTGRSGSRYVMDMIAVPAPGRNAD